MKRFVFTVALLIAAISLSHAAKELVGKPLPAEAVAFIKTKKLDGKPLIVEFWATWCPPCRQSVPHLNEIYAANKAKGLQVLGITDEPDSKVKEFAAKVPIDYTVGNDSTDTVAKAVNIETIPYAYILNKEGIVVWQGHPMEMTPQDVAKAF